MKQLIGIPKLVLVSLLLLIATCVNLTAEDVHEVIVNLGVEGSGPHLVDIHVERNEGDCDEITSLQYHFDADFYQDVPEDWLILLNGPTEDIFGNPLHYTFNLIVPYIDSSEHTFFLEAHGYVDGSPHTTYLSDTFTMPLPISDPAFWNTTTSIVAKTAQTDEAIFLQSDVQDAAITRNYINPLGMTKQTVQIQASPNQHDLVSFHEYDTLSREAVKYMPYEASTTDGSFQADYLAAQEDFYDETNPDPTIADDVAHSETVFDKSPLNRTLVQGAVGSAWQIGSGHTLEYFQRMNETGDDIIIWNVVYDYGGERCLPQHEANDYYYAPGRLSKYTTTDENGKAVVEFKDLEGNLICRKAWKNTEVLETYYVYDTRNQLRFIIPPLATHEIVDHNATVDIAFRNRYLTEFLYDSQDRLRLKHMPEMDPIKYVYDIMDRVILSQDGELNDNNQWAFKKYDSQGRVILEGIMTLPNPITQQELANQMQQQTRSTDLWEQRTTEYKTYEWRYTDNAFPQLLSEDYTCQVNAVYYYDDYDFIASNPRFNHNHLYNAFQDYGDNEVCSRTKNMLTGSWVRVLQSYPAGKLVLGDKQDHEKEISNSLEAYYIRGRDIRLKPGFATEQGYLVSIGPNIFVPQNPVLVEGVASVTYYDERGRVIQNRTGNHFDSNVDVSCSLYDFTGKVIASKLLTYDHEKCVPVTIQKRYGYDHAGRPTSVLQQIDNGVVVHIAHMEYNAIGQLIEKDLHIEDSAPTIELAELNPTNLRATRIQSIDYRYNIRGWLSSINNSSLSNNGVTNDDTDDLFGMNFTYNGAPVYSPNRNSIYNGNIAGVSWMRFGGLRRSYSYDYDNLYQLTGATQKSYNGIEWVDNGSYSVSSLTYDLNGNMQSVRRYDEVGAENDHLEYHYDPARPNRLIGVDDTSGYNEPNCEDFRDNDHLFTRDGVEYAYDDNGNMILDMNKGMNVQYNMLNLPELVEFDDKGGMIQWVYLANGTKLRKNLFDGEGSFTGGTDYRGAVVYDIDNQGDLTFAYAPHDEGRVLRDEEGDYKYVYNLCDHLGNVRVSFAVDPVQQTAQFVQADDYYPFGLRLPGSGYLAGEENPYLYNGKEWEDDHGLNWYHYGARYYDPQLGRWHSVDPADEFYSPYVYCHNDPVNFLDKDGAVQEEAKWQHYSAVARVMIWMQKEGLVEYGLDMSGDLSSQEIKMAVNQATEKFENEVSQKPMYDRALKRMGLSSGSVEGAFCSVRSNGYNSMATNIIRGMEKGCCLAVSGLLLGGGVGVLVNACIMAPELAMIIKVSWDLFEAQQALPSSLLKSGYFSETLRWYLNWYQTHGVEGPAPAMED